jgi:hypothetical protein
MPEQFEQFDLVALIDDLPAEGLAAGAVGTIVHVHDDPEPAYEVEFTDAEGRTTALTTLHPDQVRPTST